MLSILIPIYAKENPKYFEECLHSILEQTVKADEVVIVKDGPLTHELESVIHFYIKKLNIKIINIDLNVGIATALNIALSKIQNPWIMRFDSDDISVPNRIKIQKNTILINKYDLFGSQIMEFDKFISKTNKKRIVPIHHNEIIYFAKKRNPFNHMTVCFKRELALSVGGYPLIPGMEDYALWIKMINAGAKTLNDNKVLVYARTGNSMLKRRGGIRYITSEIKMQRFLVAENFKSVSSAFKDGFMRSLFFILPIFVKKFFYSFFLRGR
jgi:glycosyltransferase involved in cell wall biosynthesis